jgi:hypothetical protein
MAARIPLRVRVSGGLDSIDRLLDILRAAGLELSAQSSPRANRREPGHRVYATVRFTAPNSARTDDKRGTAPRRQASRRPAAPTSPK